MGGHRAKISSIVTLGNSRDSSYLETTPMSPDPSLFTLPLEILVRVFGCLEGRQIARCGAVSRRQFYPLFIRGFEFL
jgi:F-box-like